MAGYNLPENCDVGDPSAPWNQGMSDQELSRRRKLATLGLRHIDGLAEVIEELGLWFPLLALRKTLQEEAE